MEVKGEGSEDRSDGLYSSWRVMRASGQIVMFRNREFAFAAKWGDDEAPCLCGGVFWVDRCRRSFYSYS